MAPSQLQGLGIGDDACRCATRSGRQSVPGSGRAGLAGWAGLGWAGLGWAGLAGRGAATAINKKIPQFFFLIAVADRCAKTIKKNEAAAAINKKTLYRARCLR